METRAKVLLVDDDPGVLETYKQLLAELPSLPEIHTAQSGSRAMAMLEDETYRLLICDLKMPKVDGLQVLSIVRRKYPSLRTVAITGEHDEQFRSRAYALGIDLFWHKPRSEQEVQMFLECIESLLGQTPDDGFRGVQRKSLMDIIQLECISQSSAVLRINNGDLGGRIWIQDGEVIDAEAGELQGEPAFQRVLAWRAGTFDSLPAEPSRARTITKPYSALLLESAQAIDEQLHTSGANGETVPASPLARAAQVEGIEFVLALPLAEGAQPLSRGLENPQRMSTWARQNLERFRSLGERLNAGALDEIAGLGPHRHVCLAREGETDFCIGCLPTLSVQEMKESFKKVVALWGS